MSNRTGSWAVTKLDTIQEDAYRIRIAARPDKKIHLAWTTDEHAWYSTNATGTWMRRQLDSAMGGQHADRRRRAGRRPPALLQCTNDGSRDLDGAGIYHETAHGVVGRRADLDHQEDKPQDLLVDPAGNVHLVFAREY